MNVDLRIDEVRAGHERGWAFLPLVGKQPIEKGWPTRPRPTLEQCEEWARRGNVGLRTGRISGVVGVDLDEGCDVSGLDLPKTPTVVTGSGGRHLYYQAPEVVISNSAGKLGEHIDVRGDGGQVVFVGSVHPNTGQVYRWAEGLSPDDVDVAPLPQWIVDCLTTRSQPGGGDGCTPYGLAALEKELQTLRATPQGRRNNELNRAAFVLGQLIAGGELDGPRVQQELLAATDLPEAEATATIASGLKAGLNEPRSAPQDAVPTTTTTSPHLTDMGNGVRLIRRHGKDVRYCPPWKDWLVWDGRHWAVDTTGEMSRRAKDTALQIYREVADESQAEDRKQLVKWAKQSEAAYRLEAMIKLAQSEPGVAVSPDDLDRDPWLLNVLNGTIDLRTGRLRPHRREDLLTRLAPVTFDPDARCPTWLAFLDRIFDGNVDLIAYLQRVVGYCLTGSTREQCFFLLYGTGSNGKSVFLVLVRSLLGDYAEQTPASSFMVRRAAEGASNDLAKLRGARFVTAVETEDGQRLSEPIMKQLTGEDPITARFLFKEFFTYQPTFKVALATNHKPTIRGTDHGIWRRVRLIPFTVTIPDQEQDRELTAKLRDELPGILNWAIEGCLNWLEDGSLRDPEEVLVATDEYRREQDRFADFVEERCTMANHVSVEAGALYRDYKQWAEARGEHPFSQRRLGEWLGQQGYSRGRSNTGRRLWTGISLTTGGAS